MVNDMERKLVFQANAEALLKASYFLIDHVARSDDEHIALAARKLAEI